MAGVHNLVSTDRHKTTCDLLIYNKKPRSYYRKRGSCSSVQISLQYVYTGWDFYFAAFSMW